MADRNTNWDRERDSERNDRGNFERGNYDRGSSDRGSSDRGDYDRGDYDRNDNQQRGRYLPRGDYGPSAFNRGAGQDNELYGTGSRGYGSTWGGSNVYREGENLYRPGQANYTRQPGPGDNWQRGQHTGKGPKGYNRSDDRIREDVCEYLTRHGHIDASEIEVRVKDGEVTLTGTVNRREEKRMAEDALENVPGVRDVHNQLRTQPPNQQPNQGNLEHDMESVGSGNRRR